MSSPKELTNYVLSDVTNIFYTLSNIEAKEQWLKITKNQVFSLSFAALATLKPHAAPGMAPIPGALPPGAASQPPVPEPMEAAEGGPAGMTDEIIQKVYFESLVGSLPPKRTF